MPTSPVDAVRGAEATTVRVNDDALTVELIDGRTLTVPIVWFPRLSNATADERSNHQMIGGGVGIHWPDLDEDIEVAQLLLGWTSGESQQSLRRWLDERASRKAS
ncbi:MAG: DUF2442 domain-containing protein [Dehalococcoidia bacterium]|nr:DUF2442 domain-containing protein [Dehalococcoidia bacterium]